MGNPAKLPPGKSRLVTRKKCRDQYRQAARVANSLAKLWQNRLAEG